MIRLPLPFMLALAAPVAVAVVAPVQARDARLVSRAYSPSEVVRIESRAGVQATITFGDDELIENVAIGDSSSWQVTPNKRATLLFVKPLSASARTNMTVVTDQRSYFFDLVASPQAKPLYVLRFTYPEDTKARHARGKAGPAAELSEAEALALRSSPLDPAAETLAAPVDPATLNFAWAGKGKRQLLPARIYDDGASTYLSWAAGAPMPAILVRDHKGAEGPVNFAVRDDVVVLEGVPQLLVLRSGRDTATIENKGPVRPAGKLPAPVGARPPLDPSTATTVVAAAPTQPSPQQDD